MSEYNPTAAEVFQDLCSYFDEIKWNYEVIDGKYVKFNVKGEDLPIDISVGVQEEIGLICLYGLLPFKAPEEKVLEICMALALINNRLAAGHFDIDLSDRTISFSMTLFYKEVRMTHSLYKLLVMGSCKVIDDYNDKLLLLCKGLTSFEDFLNEELNGGAKA